MLIPVAELSALTIKELRDKYKVSEKRIIELRECHGVTRPQRQARKWCAKQMLKNLKTETNKDISLVYGIPENAVEMIRQIAAGNAEAKNEF